MTPKERFKYESRKKFTGIKISQPAMMLYLNGFEKVTTHQIVERFESHYCNRRSAWNSVNNMMHTLEKKGLVEGVGWSKVRSGQRDVLTRVWRIRRFEGDIDEHQ